MDKRKPSEPVLAKKILLLRQKYKQHKKEEKIFMKRNKKLVNEIQSYKETLKSINDERLSLQKCIYDKKCSKAISEGNNNALKSSLSSCLNQLHVLQTKVINGCIETQRESIEGNRHSPKKPAESCTQESSEERGVSEDPCRRSRDSSTLQDVFSSYDEALVCKIETLNDHEAEPDLSSPCDLPESKQELSLLMSSFCRRDTVPVNKTTESGPQQSEKVLPERTSESDFQESENPLLERICESDYEESETLPLDKSRKSISQESVTLPFEKSRKSISQESEIVSLEITCTSDFQRSENVPLERTCSLEPQLENEVMRASPREEAFYGFVADTIENEKFTEKLERLSIKCKALESLRNYEMAQSLTVFESNPEITAKQLAITSTLDDDLSKYYNIQRLEISIPRLDLSAYPSLNSTVEEIPKKSVSRGRKKKKSKQEEEKMQREATPDSVSESSSNGRSLRRARNAVSYKEKPLKTKLRRS